MTPMPVILLLSGSLRKGSTNEAVLRTVQAVAPSVGVDTAMYEDLVRLPHFNPDADTDPLPAPVAALRAALDRADAVLICTPEYAGTLPGSFKNLLDWTVGGNGDLRQAGRMDQRGRPGPWPGRGGHAADGARLHGRGRRGVGLCADPGGTGHARRRRPRRRSVGTPPTGRGTRAVDSDGRLSRTPAFWWTPSRRRLGRAWTAVGRYREARVLAVPADARAGPGP